MITITHNRFTIYTLIYTSKIKRNYINTNYSSQSDTEFAGTLTFNIPLPFYLAPRRVPAESI